MNSIRKGNIVGRKSYKKDIMFIVKNIIKTKSGNIVILKGLIDRIEADSKMEDLEIISRKEIQEKLKSADRKFAEKIKKASGIEKIELKDKRNREIIKTGKILHLDGVCFIIYMIRFMRFIKNKI